MGSRGAGSGRKSGANSTAAKVYDINSVTSAVLNKGEGKFISTDVPKLVRTNNGMEIQTEKGYATVIDDVPVFIQKAPTGRGYGYNIYGMNASMQPIRTLAEAKNPDKIGELVDRVKNAYNNVDQMQEIFNAANKKGGITQDEYTQIVRRNRAKKT